MTIKKLFCALLISMYSMGALAAAPHSIDYSRKPRNPGTIINIGGQDFVIVRFPVADFSGNRYSISYLEPLTNGSLISAGLVTNHVTDPISSNATIDGFPAQVTVSDQRSYAMTSDFSTPGTNRFTVYASATAVVTVQIGSMIVTGSVSFATNDPETGMPPETDVNIGDSFSAVSQAEWYKRTDPISRVIFLDQWVDYITIFSWQ